MEKGVDITELHVNVFKLAGILMALATAIWFLSAKSTVITSQGEQIRQVQADLKVVPTREEYTTLKQSVDEVNKNVNEIKTYLIKGK